MGELAMNVCTRPDFAPLSASPARRMSVSLARASAHTVLSLIAPAIALTAAKSPFDDAGKPASITSTRNRSSCLAMRIFSSLVIDAPGLCSPSRNVVSKMIKWSDMLPPASLLVDIRFLPGVGRTSGTAKDGYELSARGAQQQTAEEGGREAKHKAATHSLVTISAFCT